MITQPRTCLSVNLYLLVHEPSWKDVWRACLSFSSQDDEEEEEEEEEEEDFLLLGDPTHRNLIENLSSVLEFQTSRKSMECSRAEKPERKEEQERRLRH